jgi:hypothetical protein
MTYNTNPEMSDTMEKIGVERDIHTFYDFWPAADGSIIQRFEGPKDHTNILVKRTIT